MTEIAIPRARAKRRRLPRPPKFDRYEKFSLTMLIVSSTFGIGYYIAEPALWQLVLLASNVAGLHATVMRALGKIPAASQSTTAWLALWCFAVALLIAGV